jgi:hypothetical protein
MPKRKGNNDTFASKPAARTLDFPILKFILLLFA